MKTPLTIDGTLLKKAALQYRALNNRLRLKMLLFLHEQSETSVTTFYKKLKLRQSVVSMHLAILREAGLVNRKKEGKHVLYSVNHERLDLLQQQAKNLIGKKDQLL